MNGKESEKTKLNGDTVKAGEHTKYKEENFIMLNVFNFGLLSIFISRKSGRQRLFQDVYRIKINTNSRSTKPNW